jgi:hypothetical protein
MVAGSSLRAEPGPADYPCRRPAAREALAFGLGHSRRLLLPSTRTWLRARRSKLSRAPLTSSDYPRRRPAALKAPVLGLGRSRRPLSQSPRTWLRPLRARRSELGWCGHPAPIYRVMALYVGGHAPAGFDPPRHVIPSSGFAEPASHVREFVDTIPTVFATLDVTGARVHSGD